MDTLVLHALANRQRYKTLVHAVPAGMMSPETTYLLQWYGLYYSVYPERKTIDYVELESLIRIRSATAAPESLALAMQLVHVLAKSNPDTSGVISQLNELDLSGKAGALISRYNNGEEVELAYELQILASATRKSMVDDKKPQWAYRPIHELLQEDSDDGGLQWKVFKAMALTVKGLQRGTNVALCAPTDKGKSSLLVQIAVTMQEQAKVLYPGIKTLYLVNEGTADNIQRRLYNTALGMNRADMLACSNAELERRYIEIVGARDAIKAINIHGRNMAQVSGIIEAEEPHLVITDMTGRIRSSSNRGGASNDINQLEEVWNDMRELAVIHNFAHFGSVQVSAEGFNNLYPPVSALQNSKTGIQTTLDLILMMGALVGNEAAENLRGISTPKNKLARSGQSSTNKFMVHFDPQLNVWSEGLDVEPAKELPLPQMSGAPPAPAMPALPKL
jgi:hypothetical protein